MKHLLNHKNFWKLRLSRGILIIVLSFSFSVLFAQDKIPQGYFQFPIQPGTQNYLAGTMGELRATHFHAGIDIKTNGKEGLPVFAAADGYVSRIKVSTTGYGNALYITHPNGYTTVYAHLLKFNAPIGNYVKEQQYQHESFEIEIYPEKNLLPFKKGEVVGLSGNTGGSAGPHLHFEIRDSLENFLDPLLFGFSEIVDNLPPVIEKLAIKTLDINARVNGEFGRLEFKPELVGNEYVVNTPIQVKGLLGLEILAFDKADKTSNKYGVSCIEMKIDGQEIFYHKMERMPFDAARKILIHTNFEVAQTTNRRFQKLFLDDGNNINIYNTTQRGKFRINDSLTHKVEIKLWDTYQNVRKLSFSIKGNPNIVFNLPGKGSSSPLPSYQLHENVLKIICREDINKRGTLAKIITNTKTYELNPAYKISTDYVYLWDLRSGLPDSANLCDQKLQFGFSQMIPPGRERYAKSKYADIRFPENALFDTLYLDVKKINNMYKVQSPYIPLYDYVFIKIKPEGPVVQSAKTNVYSINSNNSYNFEGGEFHSDGSIAFKTKYFSYYMLAPDTIPPSIKFASKTLQEVRFIITDNLSGINTYRATLEGKWLLMNYDYKRKLLWSSQKDDRLPLKGNLELVVTDNAGNSSVFKYKL